MRIALLAPLVAPIAPPFLGGAQAMLYDLAAGLAARGHTVTLYAADGSAVPGVACVPLGIDATALLPARFNLERLTSDRANALEAPDATFFTQAHAFLRIALHIRHHADQYDLLHAHAFDWPAFTFGALLPLPVLHTLHLPAASQTVVEALATLASDTAPHNTHLATVSRACAATYAPGVIVPTIVYNGIHVEAIPFGARPDPNDPYLCFAGRIAPEKGVEDALAIARGAQRRVVIAGGVYDEAYYQERVRPLLEELGRMGLAEYVGPLPREQVWQLMAGAEAVLCPSHWEEPFGLVPCEAQATGAPVVGYAIGALPEVVADGATGWLVPPRDVASAAAAVGRVARIDRAACRRHVVERFSLGTMLDGYERVYGELVRTRAGAAGSPR